MNWTKRTLSILLVFLLLAFPTFANGEEISTSTTNQNLSSQLNVHKLLKQVQSNNKEDYLNPSSYQFIKPGQIIATLTDSYGGKQSFTLTDVSSYSADLMDIQIRYTSDYSYFKDPLVDLEFYNEKSGSLSYSGYTEFNTSGNTSATLHSKINKSEFSSQKYIYVRLGISDDNSDYYSDVIQFKIDNPFYNTTSGSGTNVPAPKGDYVIISNESIDGSSRQSTGSAKWSNTLDKKGVYPVDFNKPFPVKPDKNKLFNKRFSIQGLTYQVGAKKDFWVSNLKNETDYQINAELLYSGTHANVWVNNNYLTTDEAKKLGQEFDLHIYPTVTSNFGKESDVNRDGKINILCYDIQDGFNGSGGYVAGYFYAGDLYDKSYNPTSNESEIFYIDTYPAMGLSSASKDVAAVYETLAHEFQHMVNYNQNVLVEGRQEMDVWMDEGLSMASEQIYTGQPLSNRIDYYNRTDSIANGQSLLYWDDSGDVLANYSLSYLFFQYLKIQAGQGNKIFKEIINDPSSNYQAIENVIHKYINPNLSFGKFMTDFRAALLLKMPTGLYGFKGDSSFDALQPRLYSGSAINLRGGGAIAMEASNATVVPSNKGDNITYTYLNKDGRTLNVNPTKPTVNSVSDRDTTVKGKTAVNTTVYVQYGSKTLGKQSVRNSQNFTISIPKQKAGTKLTVNAVDAYGNKSSSVTITVLDKTAPARPTINPVGDNQLNISGKAESGSNVIVKKGRTIIGKATANSSNKYTVKLKAKLKTGTVITVSATDKAGNQSSTASAKVLDKTPPKKPSVNKLTPKSRSILGSSEKGSTVYIYKGSKCIAKGKTNSKGHYKIRITSQKKGTSITIYAKDSSGNKSKSVVVKVH